MRRIAAFLAVAMFVCVAAPVPAQQQRTPPARATATPAAAPAPSSIPAQPGGSMLPASGREANPREAVIPDAVTHHTVAVGGRTLAYTARAGSIPLRDAAGEETAQVFSVAYTLDGADKRTRPVTFVWNGGPGSSTMWLHMASYGPVRAEIPSNATPPAPGTPYGPNPDTLLDLTDLVFIDAVGTGYSRIVGKGTPAMFFGIDQDADAFDNFIREWTTRNDRWGSPKFLFGESYGTTRAADVVDRLQGHGMAIDGVVLLSSVLDFNVIDNDGGPGEDYGYIAFLPTEAAVAWYHHAIPGNPPDLAAFVAQVRAFAAGPYASALQRGDELDPATRRAVVARLHDYTGLDPGYIERADLRIDPSRFEHQLLLNKGITTGRLDGRYEGPTFDPTADATRYDPTSDSALTDAIVSDFSAYLRDDLDYRADRPYLGTNYPVVGAHWDQRLRNSILTANVAGHLRTALIENPYLRVFSANGYYDLATPFFGTEYTLGHLQLPPAVRSHIEYGFYPSGHMVYLNDEARRAFKADLVRFYGEATAR
jgi:carboxypeptidase C (cathepsin A)